MSDDPNKTAANAAEAYYAISSLLADCTGETPLSDKKSSSDFAHDDDEYGTQYVSRRISGAFSPPARSAATSGTATSNTTTRVQNSLTGGVDDSTQWSTRRKSSDTLDGKRAKDRNSNSDSRTTPLPLVRTGAPELFPTNKIRDSIEVKKHPLENSEQEEEETVEEYEERESDMKSFHNDYQPYHDALFQLIKSKKLHPSKQLEARISYCQYLRDSNYNLSLALQDKIQEGTSLALEAGTDTQSTYACEMEGHVWSLLERLTVGNAIAVDNSEAAMDVSMDAMVDARMDMKPSSQKEPPCMILWEEHHVQSTHHATLLQEWVELLTRAYPSLDSVGVTQVLDSCLRGDHELAASLPLLTQRRQLILDWIESCHNRSAMECYPVSSKERIMWTDTLEQLSTYGRNQSGKISTIHPDAPLVLLGEECKSSMDSTSNARSVQPLYGNDESRDIVLLSACLSLMKAGRYSDVLEKCREFGQPWRAAAWNGNEVFGVVTVEDERKEDWNETIGESVRIGNPKRMLWKRNMWHVSKAMHNLLLQTSASSKGMLASGSVAYEAAISAILADDTNTALENPILKQNWMDLVWVYFKGQQSRFIEQVYHSHNTARRGKGDSFLEGSEFEKEEKVSGTCKLNGILSNFCFANKCSILIHRNS